MKKNEHDHYAIFFIQLVKKIFKISLKKVAGYVSKFDKIIWQWAFKVILIINHL
jgi:hypothetical protein